jgi:hypothetical protein
MSKFDFKTLSPGLPEQLLQKSVLWIWNADKIPPHIGISVGKDYFSLTYQKSEHLLTSSMLKKAKRAAIPLVLVELPKEVIQADLGTVFSKYERAMDGVTCLQPIREVMHLNEEINQLADLLIHFESKGLIHQVNGLNLPKDYLGIPNYSMEEILVRIKTLNGKLKKSV